MPDDLAYARPACEGLLQQPTAPEVLVVDDYALARKLLLAQVQWAGYHGVAVAGPDSALATLEETPGIKAVLTDVHMPDKESGISFIRILRRHWRHLSVVVVTGRVGDLDGLRGTPDGPVLILSKPVRAHRIREALHQSIGESGNGSALPEGAW